MVTTDDGNLVLAARAGDSLAFGRLFDGWFDRVHDLSRRIVHDDGIAAEVAQDVFLKAWQKLPTLDDPDAFGGWVLRIARNSSLNRLEHERRAVATDDTVMSAMTDALAPDADPLANMDQAARIALVWDAAAALGERDASVLDLHLRHGLTAADLADELGMTPNNAHQVLFNLRKRLGNAVRALVLWRAGHPTCADLRQELAAAGLTSFGAPMVQAIDKHTTRCEDCARDRTERVSPAALFAAAPIIAAPLFLKTQAASALEAAGVPMAGSSATSAGSTGVGGSGGSGAGAEPVTTVVQAVDAGGAAAETDEPDHSAMRRTRHVIALAAVFLLVLGVATGVVLAKRAGHDELDTVAAVGSSTTLLQGGTTTVSEAPPASTVTDPTGSVVTQPGAPTVTTAPTATTAPAPTTTTVPAPVIDRFLAALNGKPCDGNDLYWDLAWETTGADTVVIGRTTDKGSEYPVDGTTTVCAPGGTVFFLNAIGPGGTTSATSGGDQPPPTTTTTTIVIG